MKLDLRAESIRILAPIPGKDAVGIELPNKVSSPVSLLSVIGSSQWKKATQEIPVALGKKCIRRGCNSRLGKSATPSNCRFDWKR